MLLSNEIAPPLTVVAQVAQAIVPLVVMVPPVIGEVVAILVTVPLPPLVQPLVVAPPLASVQRLAPVPETVPTVSSLVSVPWVPV